MKRYIAAAVGAVVGAIVGGIVVVLLFSDTAAGQSRIYLADEANHEITWTYTDGSNQTEISTSAPISLEIDQAGGWVYWLTANYGHGQWGNLMRARLHDPSQPEVLYETSYTEGGLELDPVEQYAYWGVPGIVEPPAPDFSIVREKLDGSGWENWIPGASNRLYGMDLDPKARLLFWTAGDALMRAHLDVKTSGPLNLDWGSMEERPFNGGVAVDSMYRKVYWAEGGTPYGPLNGVTSRIFRAQYSGGPVTVVYEGYETKVTDLVFEPVTRTLFWLERFLENNVEKLAIKKAHVENTFPLTATEVFRPARQPRDLAVFADPGATHLTAPGETETAETTAELSWMPVLGSLRYDVQVATDPDFTSIVFHENTPATRSEFVAPVAEKTYYWRVQSNACLITPHWSATRSLNVGNTGPLAAQLTYPVDGGKAELHDTFTWDPAPGAATYGFQIAPHEYFGNVLVHGSDLTTTNFEVSGLERGETYFWRVAGFDSQGRYTYTHPQTFTVATLLTAVSLDQPADGSGDIDPATVFKWTSLEGADSYELEVATDSDFGDVLHSIGTQSTSYTVDAPFPYETVLYWRVRGVNQSGPGAWSETWQFTTAAEQALAAVTLSEPSNGSQGVEAYTAFAWTTLDGAESYELQVSTDANFSGSVQSIETENTTYTVDTPFAYETTHFWRVRGMNDAGPGEWSDVWQFTTAVGTGTGDPADVPVRTELLHPYPNPADNTVEIPFTVAEPINLTLNVFALDGRLIRSDNLGRLTSGRYLRRLNTADWPAGIYTIVMDGHGQTSKSIVVVR